MIRRILRTSTPSRIAVLVCALASLLIAQELSAQTALTHPEGLPEWAFNIPDENAAYGPMRPEGIVRVPGSAIEYDATEIAGSLTPPDWFPDEHPPAPRSVTGGPGIRFACGACHLMSGQGHPESADLAGLPVEYFIRQMAYYKAGTRKEEHRMGRIAQLTSDENVREAAEYFAALTPTKFVEVIETATPPKTFIGTQGRHRQLDPDGGTEPIGRRILQIPADSVRHRNPGPACRVYRVRATWQYRQRRGVGRRRHIRQDGAMRAVSRRGTVRPGRSPAARWTATAVCRATALPYAIWLERGEGCGVDEACRRQSDGR